jgi:hypothetical protein
MWSIIDKLLVAEPAMLGNGPRRIAARCAAAAPFGRNLQPLFDD